MVDAVVDADAVLSVLALLKGSQDAFAAKLEAELRIVQVPLRECLWGPTRVVIAFEEGKPLGSLGSRGLALSQACCGQSPQRPS